MTDFLIYSIGFIAQILFSLRFFIQWVKSEKQKKIIVPDQFWIFSLIGALLLFLYGFLRHDFAIMMGQVLTYFIYIRNLQLQNLWNKIHVLIRLLIIGTPAIILLYTINTNVINLGALLGNETISKNLLILGITSQIIFSLRFVYQWLYSEKRQTSHLPLGFWILSSIGSLLILIYAIYRKDPVLFVAHLIGTILYLRNIFILKKGVKK